MALIDEEFWRGRRVFITGHTGFMGGWLSCFLLQCGADVTGFALPAPTEPSFFDATRLSSKITQSVIGDIREPDTLKAVVQRARPSIVFHLAAQPLVRRAFAEPALTFDTNVMGTVNLLEAVLACSDVDAVMVVTTDKVYRNDDRGMAFSEEDRLGGREPYGASKAAAEFAVDAYRQSYFLKDGSGKAPVGIGSIRAGNIFGGGDWAVDRLVCDAVRSFSANQPLRLRNPGHTRPWQHVLNPLPGYLVLAQALCRTPGTFSSGWNFGPPVTDSIPVVDFIARMKSVWNSNSALEHYAEDVIVEARLLSIDSTKAIEQLGWKSIWPLDTSIAKTVEWYKTFYRGEDVWPLSQKQCLEIIQECV